MPDSLSAAAGSPGLYLYRDHDECLVAVTADIQHRLDPGEFKAAVVGGRPMDSAAAMALLRRFGGRLISADGSRSIRRELQTF